MIDQPGEQLWRNSAQHHHRPAAARRPQTHPLVDAGDAECIDVRLQRRPDRHHPMPVGICFDHRHHVATAHRRHARIVEQCAEIDLRPAALRHF